MRKWIITILVSLLLLTYSVPVAVLWWYSESPRVAFPLYALRLKTLGALPDKSWLELFPAVVRPSFWHAGFLELNITNPLDSPEDVEAGHRLYSTHCSFCHGGEGKGVRTRDLSAEAIHRRLDNTHLYSVIARGVPGTEMAGFAGSSVEILQLVSFVRSLKGKLGAPTEQREAACEPCKAIDVSHERLTNAPNDPSNWLMHAGAFHGRRFSKLDQISRRTVSRLRLKWVHQPNMPRGAEAVPLVIDGVMFLTGPENEVIALNARTGEPMWTFERTLPTGMSLCCGQINRGVAALGKRVYHSTLDGHLIALDMPTGQQVWAAEVADYREGYSLTAAPLAVKDKLVVGVAGGEYPTRGFLDAYDAETGERVWRFYTIPGPGERGHETWENDSWKTGGGSTWMTGSYDPELNLVYWGTGNPAPSFNGEYRPGDNLYTCSVIALDADTGELKWHYQFVPHDVNDWDAAITPILADLKIDGIPRKVMLWSNRNCFYYILDRKTGEFLQATEYCKQNWNDGFSEEGRPIRRPGTIPTEEGALVYPAYVGGSNWFAPAFSPLTELYYVNTVIADFVLRRQPPDIDRGRKFLGGEIIIVPGTTERGALVAIEAPTGRIVWERRSESFTRAGILATAGGLVFTGTGDGNLVALDAATGEEVLVLRLGGPINSGPITYLLDGKQQLAAVAQGSVFVLEVVE